MKKLAKLTDSEEGGRQDGTASVNARLWLYCYIHQHQNSPANLKLQPGSQEWRGLEKLLQKAEATGQQIKVSAM